MNRVAPARHLCEQAAESRQPALLREIADYYRAKYLVHGDSARGMDWRDESSQRLRFEVLFRAMGEPLEGSLIDIGCGNGELLAFLRGRGSNVRYQGLDVCREMVRACRRRFGDRAASVGSTDDLERRALAADWLVASGTFNVRQGIAERAWRDHFRKSVKEMFRACRSGVVFNVMSVAAEIRYERLYYVDAADIPELAAHCGADDWHIEHGYPLFEMTVSLLRRASQRSDPR